MIQTKQLENGTEVPYPETISVDVPAGDFITSRKPGVSVVTACMDRNENLMRALKSWLVHKEIKEILIVDWSSSTPVYEDLVRHNLLDPRIRVVRAINQPRWVLTYAFNLGFRLASRKKVLKADADIMLSEDFFQKNRLRRGEFVAGNWQLADEGQTHVNGFFYIHHEDLMTVNGFNEFIATYGWDDDDLYSRLEHMNVSRRNVDPATIYHQDHDDAQRLNFDVSDKDNALEQLNRDTFFQIRTNRFIANTMPVWGRRSGFLPMNVRRQSDSYLEVEQVREGFHKIPPHVQQDARYYAGVEIVSWRTSRRVYDLEKAKFWRYLAAKPLEEMHRLDISIMAYTDRPVDFSRPSLMLSCDLEAYGKYLSKPSVLQTLQSLCATQNIKVVLHVDNKVFPECRERVEAYEQLYCIPASEAYGVLDFQDFSEAIALITSGKDCLQAGCEIAYGTPALAQLLSALSLAAPTRPKGPYHSIKRDRVFIDAQHGLGNRLRAIASGAAIAERTDRDFVVVWEPDHHCEAGMRDLFDYDGALIEEAFVHDLGPETDFYTYMEIEPGAQKDAPVTLHEGRDLYVRTSCVVNSIFTDWPRENAFLKSLTPTAAVRELVAPFDVKGNTAIHVRMEGDTGGSPHTYEKAENWSGESHDLIQHWRQKSHYSHFIKRVDALLKDDPDMRFFLAADMAATYKAFSDVFGDRIQFLARERYDRSKEQIVYALADAILLSKCQRLLGSTWSSFSEIAMRLTNGYDFVEMSGRDL